MLFLWRLINWWNLCTFPEKQNYPCNYWPEFLMFLDNLWWRCCIVCCFNLMHKSRNRAFKVVFSCLSLKLASLVFHYHYPFSTTLPSVRRACVTGSSLISLTHRRRRQRSGRGGEEGTSALWVTVSSLCCSASEPTYSSSGKKNGTILTAWFCFLRSTKVLIF